MFELLFNYPRSLWQEASLVFDSSWPWVGLPLAMLLIAALIALSLYRRSLTVKRRWVIGALQMLAATVLLTMLWRPALLVSITEPGENTIAWLLDTSASMAREDVQPDSPGAAPQRRLDAGLDILQQVADEKDADFAVTLYAFGDALTPVESILPLRDAPLAARSRIAPALDSLLSSVNETALAAVVLVSDGADNSDIIDAQWWQSLVAAGVPVHTIGTGSPRNVNDVEINGISLPDRVQPDTQVSARIRVGHAQAGLARIRITAGDELVAAQDISLPEGSNNSVHTIRFGSGKAGIRQLDVDVELVTDSQGNAAATDPYPANNQQPHILQVADDPKRILYVEGEPRWEYKFIRRAMDEHPGVDVVSLLRTSPNKFYRQGVRDASELNDGFPKTREQLFAYDAVIIGSLEAAELSTVQQSALRDFVAERGGSLLMLAGRHGLADGGWGRSVAAAALPVVLSGRTGSDTFIRQRAPVIPTLAGFRTPWLHLADSDSLNQQAWSGLPELADIQSVGQIKPGAVVLLERESVEGGVRRLDPLLVLQRYGRGQSAVLGTSGTWRWQMSLDSADQRHERFWRQMLGALVEGNLRRMSIEATNTVFRDSDSAEVAVQVYNPDYSPLQATSLPMAVTRPDGVVETIELYPDQLRPGRFTGQVSMQENGPYSLVGSTPINGESPSTPPVSVEQWWMRQSGNAEQFDAQLDDAFLQRIAESTGGRYLPLADIDQLSTILTQDNAALKRENRLPLWNMPVLFLCLFLAKAIEWLLRLRWKRL